MTEEIPSSPADEIVDDLLPADLDWRHLVCEYPISSLTAAAIGGFLVGRRHGLPLLQELSSFVADEVSRNVQALIGAPAGGDSSD